MQSHYPESFAREMTCTEADWLRWLPGAVGEQGWTLQGAAALVHLGDGVLRLRWQVGPVRAIASVRMPRLVVHFEFAGVPETARHAFMQRFDLYMQRGGG